VVNLRPKVQGSIGGFGVSRFVGFTPVAGARADLWQKPLENNLTKLADSLGALSPTLTKLLQTQQGIMNEEGRTEVQRAFASKDAATKRRLSEMDSREWESVDPAFAGDSAWRKVFIEETQGKYRAEVDLYDALSKKVGELSDPKMSREEVVSRTMALSSSLRPEGTFAGRAFDSAAATILQNFNEQSKALRSNRMISATAEAYEIRVESSYAHALENGVGVDPLVFGEHDDKYFNLTGLSGRKIAFGIFDKMARDHISLSDNKADAFDSVMALYADLKDVQDGSGARWGAIESSQDSEVFMENMERLTQASRQQHVQEGLAARDLAKAAMKHKEQEWLMLVDRVGWEAATEQIEADIMDIFKETGVKDEDLSQELMSVMQNMVGLRKFQGSNEEASSEAYAGVLEGTLTAAELFTFRPLLSQFDFDHLLGLIRADGSWNDVARMVPGSEEKSIHADADEAIAREPSITGAASKQLVPAYEEWISGIVKIAVGREDLGTQEQINLIQEMVKDGKQDFVDGFIAGLPRDLDGTMNDLWMDRRVRTAFTIAANLEEGFDDFGRAETNFPAHYKAMYTSAASTTGQSFDERVNAVVKALGGTPAATDVEPFAASRDLRDKIDSGEPLTALEGVSSDLIAREEAAGESIREGLRKARTEGLPPFSRREETVSGWLGSDRSKASAPYSHGFQPGKAQLSLKKLRESYLEIYSIREQGLPGYENTDSYLSRVGAIRGDRSLFLTAVREHSERIRTDSDVIAMRQVGVTGVADERGGLSIDEIRTGQLHYGDRTVQIDRELIHPAYFPMVESWERLDEMSDGEIGEILGALTPSVQAMLKKDAAAQGMGVNDLFKYMQTDLVHWFFMRDLPGEN